MNPAYAYTPDIWPPLITAALLIAGCVYCWRYREMPGARALIVNMLVGAAFGCVSALGAAAGAPAAALFWHELATGLLGFGALTMTCFVLEYTYPGRWATPRNVVLLSLPPLFFLVAILIGALHLVWPDVSSAEASAAQAERALVGQLIDTYAALLSLANLVAFAWLFMRSPQHRWPVALMAIR